MWSYWRDDFAEYGSWAGDGTPVSGVHFHDEQQLTFVISGCRHFRIAGRQIRVAAGSCLYIPAGCAHGSLPVEHAGTRCLNLYSSALEFGPEPQVIHFIDTVASRTVLIPSPHAAIRTAPLPSDRSIGQLAAEAGLSREGFTRKFTRQTGMPPHAHNLVRRLNDARRQLRCGVALADVAVDCGFFDQTHFARHFFRVFGTTPGGYRKGVS